MMLDDEIVFLGTSKAPGGQPASPAQRPVTGISLYIEKQGPIEGYGMLFRRANTSVVHIGRRSGFEPSRSPDDEQQGNAMFRCAVVSRRHAKIAFSDSGHAYLIDLGSHHGTHVRKPGDKFSKTLKPETPTLLVGGDIVTFGKTVGKGDECVRPIVARIELLHAGQNTPTNQPLFKPLVVPVASSTSSKSGRYGVHHSSSSSSDESYCSSPGVYSDIEEVPPPTSPTSKPPVSQSQSNNNNNCISQNNPGFLGETLNNVLRLRFLPPSHPSHVPSMPKRLPSVSEIVEGPLSQMSSFFFGSDPVPISPSFSPILSLPELDRQASPSRYLPPIGFDASQHDIYERDSVNASFDGEGSNFSSENSSNSDTSHKSRSHSPMDLGSPTPAPEVSREVSAQLPAPFVVSPTPSRRPSPIPSGQPSLPPLISPSQSESPSVDMGVPLVNSPEFSGANSPLSDCAASPNLDWESNKEAEDMYLGSVEPLTPALQPSPLPSPVAAITPTEVKHIQETLVSLKADVAKLQSHRRKYKARFNSNVHVITEKLGEFDDRLLEVNAEYIMLSNQVDNVVHVDMPDLNGHLEVMQERMDEFMEEREELDRERVERQREMEDDMNLEVSNRQKGKEEISNMLERHQEAVDELATLRASMKELMQQELAAFKTSTEAALSRLMQIREEHEQAVAKGVLAGASQTPVLTSLKRKRDDTDEDVVEDRGETEKNENENENKTIHAALAEDAESKNKDVVMDSNDVPSANLELEDAVAVAVAAPTPDAPPPRKRAKRFASIVAQTATAVTIGAVVTWSALAFS